MSDRVQDLIGTLTAELRPVRRLRPPLWRATVWLLGALTFGAVVTSMGSRDGAAAAWTRFTMLPDLGLTLVGAVLTAVLGAVAAFELSLPDRTVHWIWLPVPAAALWLAASGWGCLRGYGLPWLAPATMMDGMGCMGILGSVSVPLSIGLMLLLRQARPLRPGLVSFAGGIASAGAAGAMLCFLHPHDASAIDLLMHVVAVAAVLAAVRLWGGRVLATAG